MRNALFILASTLLCLTMNVVSAQTEDPGPDEPTPISGPAVNANPLNLVATDSVVFVRFTHVAADAPPVDLYLQELGELPVVEALAFGEERDFVFLPAGSHTVIARAAGSGADGEIITSTDWNFQRDTSWLVAFAGLTSNASLQLEPINLLRDDIVADRSRVRVVNLVSEGTVLSVSSSTGDDFGQMLGWIGVFDTDVTPGAVNLSIVSSDGTALLTDSATTLVGGALNTLLLVGSADGSPPLQILSFSSPATLSRVQFVNDRDTAIQIFFRPGNLELVGSLAPGELSDWLDVPSGAVTFVAYAPGTGPTGQELSAWIGALQPMRDWTITFMPDGGANESDPVFSPGAPTA